MSTYDIFIPNDQSLAGQTFYTQGVTMDLAVRNPFGGAVTNGLEFKIQC